ncbi:MAG TPA: nuclear transport factor 2 family protein [Alphaproteobacteria bacterium]|nr:nuclear transport factor 2 family protein [Alphaproteobacteria bacterium]
MKKIQALLLLVASFLAIAVARADSQIEATHNALRAMRDGLMDAVNKGDIDRELTYLTTNVVVTWHDATVSRGREGVRDYYNRMMNGPNKVVSDFHAEINVDELTILYGDSTGIAFGSSLEHFKLVNGNSFDLKGRWTATMIKQDGHWLVASLHVSTNIFDNVMLDIMKKYAIRAAWTALIVGFILGWLIGRIRRKARVPNPSN